MGGGWEVVGGGSHSKQETRTSHPYFLASSFGQHQVWLVGGHSTLAVLFVWREEVEQRWKEINTNLNEQILCYQFNYIDVNVF